MNENIVLTSLNNLFVREHNRICTEMGQLFKNLSDEQLYIYGKNYVAGLISKITYDDFLPLLLGADNDLRPYNGYEKDVEPSITNIFSTAAFRYGHFTIPNFMIKMKNNGEIVEKIKVRDGTQNPVKIQSKEDIGYLLKGESENLMKKRTIKMSDELRNFLVDGPAKRNVILDLAALNIQRGRDHGLPDFNTFRKFFGLQPYTNFSQITNDEKAWKKL